MNPQLSNVYIKRKNFSPKTTGNKSNSPADGNIGLALIQYYWCSPSNPGRIYVQPTEQNFPPLSFRYLHALNPTFKKKNLYVHLFIKAYALFLYAA